MGGAVFSKHTQGNGKKKIKISYQGLLTAGGVRGDSGLSEIKFTFWKKYRKERKAQRTAFS